ncbi:hypothetical protein L873DRAFT_1662152 [Choiromyces venosus 120613-1]|uniref:Zn(2)-C6 fungal-type domain-containing protein n=1 Tax=Choiromyces venosus 120613-1 TaxID=1336337 RepID=A0A3N4K4V7_9PEZI|nr:hypothetical protein L873DRAFT_1662152 [Choiromyces venosus 120613-1]
MPATVDCYTCRRRRVRCDRALPHCEKCTARPGLDCLGYKKPLVWNKGVASRGKMMGKTFPLPKPTRLAGVSGGGGGGGCEEVVAAVGVRRVQKEEDSSGRSSSPESEVGGGGFGGVGRVVVVEKRRSNNGGAKIIGKNAGTGTTACSGGGSSVESRSDGEDPSSSGAIILSHSNNSNNITETYNYLRPFNPEFFGDLDSTSKYYLNYFDKRVCRDFILFERHGDNPYRNLLSLAASHPSFLHAALAVSARHYSNNTGYPETHALVYKGRAINSLSRDLQQPNYDDEGTGDMVVREPVLAAMLLFLFFEALESGKDTWKIHLQGARRLIQMSGGQRRRGSRSNLSSSLGVLITHVAAIDIIGQSLAFSKTPTPTPTTNFTHPSTPPTEEQDQEEIFHSLGQAEHYSFLGCPAELLRVISLVSKHKNFPSPSISPSSPSPADLMSRIHRFSPEAWVRTRLPSLNQNAAGSSIPRLDARELYHHVCAYKCAVHIFALQVLPPSAPPSGGGPTAGELVDEIITHLSSFEPSSVFFKGAMWPIFLAGAAATSEPQRAFVRATLANIWALLPQCNIKSAGVLLEEMWRDGDGHGGDWKERLARSGSDYLFI